MCRIGCKQVARSRRKLYCRIYALECRAASTRYFLLVNRAFLGIAALIRCANEIEREFDRWLVDSLIEIQAKRRRHVRTPTLITTDERLEIFWSEKKPTRQVTIYLCISGFSGGRTGFARNVSQRSKTRADHSRTYKAKRGACQRYIYGWISRVWKAFS